MIENKTVSLKIFLLENKLKIFSRCKRRGEDNASPGFALIVMHNLRVYHFDKPPLIFFCKCCTGRAVLAWLPGLALYLIRYNRVL